MLLMIEIAACKRWYPGQCSGCSTRARENRRVATMAGDRRDLTRLLKDELLFIQLGGYDSSNRGAWSPKSIFRDSLTCINFGLKSRARSCSNCHLFHFVDSEHRSSEIPCHFIRITDTGETIADLESAKHLIRLKREIRQWLRRRICELEMEPLQLSNSTPVSHSEPL